MGYVLWYIDMVIYHFNMVILGIWANDMGDDSIDTVISHIDMGYLVTLHQALLGPVLHHSHELVRPLQDTLDTLGQQYLPLGSTVAIVTLATSCVCHFTLNCAAHIRGLIRIPVVSGKSQLKLS